MTNVEWKAEALYQLEVARKSGMSNFAKTESDGMIIFYRNGTVTMNNGHKIQFELNGEVCVIEL